MVQPRHAVDRLPHQMSGVERQHDRVIALDAKFLADQPAMPGRMFPVDAATIHAGDEIAQRIELGAAAAVALHFHPERRIAVVEL